MSHFLRAYPPARPAAAAQIRLLFRDQEVLVSRDGDSVRLPTEADNAQDVDIESALYLGTLDEVACIAAEIPETAAIPSGFEFASLRDLYGKLSEEQYGLVGYAMQIVAWRRDSQFCPTCGAPTETRDGDWGRVCTACGRVRYPPVSPAVLILVHDGDRILLGHKPGWGSRYSILAGFVEPGESLEECVRREAMEEAGVVIDRLAFAGSQPWPYPHQIMVGFTAEYVSGEIRVDNDELDDARWFAFDQLPDLPAPLSLSRQMIDAWRQNR